LSETKPNELSMWLKVMSDIGLRASKLLVKDVMSSPVVTIEENAPANRAAELMDKHGLGCIIVTSKDSKPLGIITERDLVRRVLAKNLKPDAANAKNVMTAPLISVDAGEKISEAARKMNRLNIRRLGVTYKGKLVGLISSKDILAVMPELLETIQERAIIEREEKEEVAEGEATSSSGFCDACGAWSDTLQEVNGDFLCEDCRAELETGE